jgi:rhodanese-related sulfurtransferase
VKTLIILVLLVAVVLVVKRMMAGPSISPAEALARLEAGTAVLIDVREPAEYGAGVAGPALLLPMSDLRGERKNWAPALEANRDKELILYCASGARSGMVAGTLRGEGYRAVNIGGYSGWRAAGLPVRQP